MADDNDLGLNRLVKGLVLVWGSMLLWLLLLPVGTTQASAADAPTAVGATQVVADDTPTGDTPLRDRNLARGQEPLVNRAAEIPPMYQVTSGPQGEPDAKLCVGCSEILSSTVGGGQVMSETVPPPYSGWQVLAAQDFETEWPVSGTCWLVHDASDDGFERTWGSDDYRAYSGTQAAWPAAGGAEKVIPKDPVNYPSNLDSWLLCGPLDLSEASSAYASFWLWSQVEEGNDEVFFGVGDGSDGWFYGLTWGVSVTDSTSYTIYFPEFTGSPEHEALWVAWNFQSDVSNTVYYEGPWLDDIEIARSLPCPHVDPGPKGLQVHPYELPGQVIPIADAGADWVRLEFLMNEDDAIDLDRYEAIVDGLCEQGVATLGLVDYVTIPDDDLDEDGIKDYNDSDAYLDYQQRFTGTVEHLAHHFRGNIRAWEVWNEENGGQWHIQPGYYARLLVKVADTLRAVDAQNKVLFGGLDHVWETSQYLEPVYTALDNDWGGARPFDVLAVHPYFTKSGDEFILDPNEYLWDDSEPPETTLDAYLDLMADKGDGDKEIWITEIGWNSALDNPALANCPDISSWCVTRATQAEYLADSFDILFDEVEPPTDANGRVGAPTGGNDRVTKIIWYQYQDTASSAAELAAKVNLDRRLLGSDPDAICPADWGLVDGNREPKRAYWTYQIYPQRPAAWTLLSFAATPLSGTISVTWETGSELDLVGLNLYRSESADGARTPVNPVLIPAQVPGTTGGAEYAFPDSDLTPGMAYYYFLEGLNADASTTTYGPVRATVPEGPALPLLLATSDSPTALGSPTTLTATVTMTPALESVAGATLVESGTVTYTWTYSWTLGDGASLSGAVVTHTFNSAGVYTAAVTATATTTATPTTTAAVVASDTITEYVATTNVVVQELITGLVATNNGPTDLGDPTMLTATLEAGSNPVFVWSFGDGTLDIGAVVTHTFQAAGPYTTVVTATNSVGWLTATSTVQINPRYWVHLPMVIRSGPQE